MALARLQRLGIPDTCNTQGTGIGGSTMACVPLVQAQFGLDSVHRSFLFLRKYTAPSERANTLDYDSAAKCAARALHPRSCIASYEAYHM